MNTKHSSCEYRIRTDKWEVSSLRVEYSVYGPTFSFVLNWPVKSKYLKDKKIDTILMLVKYERQL